MNSELPTEPDKSGWQTCPYCKEKIAVPISQHTRKPGRCWAFDLVVERWRIVLDAPRETD